MLDIDLKSVIPDLKQVPVSIRPSWGAFPHYGYTCPQGNSRSHLPPLDQKVISGSWNPEKLLFFPSRQSIGPLILDLPPISIH